MKQIKIFWLFLLITALIGCSNNSEVINNYAIDKANKCNQDVSKIKLSDENIKIEEKGLDYLRTLPMPRVVFDYETKADEKIELTEEFNQVIENYWKDNLQAQHRKITATDGDALYDSMYEISSVNLKAERGLEQVEINFPDGKRKISKCEAEEITTQYNKYATTIIKDAEALK